MPPAHIAIKEKNDDKLRAMIYGKDKTKKTWWALRCLEAGYNVVLLDGDDGRAIYRQGNFTEEQLSRLFMLDLVDTLANPVFSKFIARLVKGTPFIWNETIKRIEAASFKPDNSYYLINPALLGRNTVLVADSWTALATSVMVQYSEENKIDLSEAAKQEWEGYGWQGRFLSWILSKLHGLNCHLIVIGHEVTQEKRSSDGKTVLWSRVQPISSSNNHASTLGKHFSEFLHFSRGSETIFYIDARGASDRDGGSRTSEAKKFRWEELPPSILLERIDGVREPSPQTAFQWFESGVALQQFLDSNKNAATQKAVSTEGTPAPVIEATTVPKVSATSFAFGAKK